MSLPSSPESTAPEPSAPGVDWVRNTCSALGAVGALTPFIAVLRGAGPKEVSGAALMMMAIWGALPFVLAPVAGRLARRAATRIAAVGFVGLATLIGVLGHFAGLVPKVPNATDSLAFVFLPVWQWPVLLLAAVLARVAPAPRPQP
jgi:hypothetical protein